MSQEEGGTRVGADLSVSDPVMEAISDTRLRARKHRTEKLSDAISTASTLLTDLSTRQQQLVAIAGEKGVSSWLTAMPSWAGGTVLKKSDFRDALCIRYGFQLDGIPESCVCGGQMDAHHALTCPTGGYPSARHDEVRDLLAGVMKELLPDVETEPRLQPLQGENLKTSCNQSQEARLDIRARGFWSRQQDAFFDVRVTDPRPSLLCRSEILSQLRSHEQSKKAMYGERVNNVERAAFTPLVFSTNGMAGPETTIFLKSLAALVIERNSDLHYSVVLGELRCRVTFCLLRWAVTCFRGCRASYTRRKASGSFAAYCRRLA